MHILLWLYLHLVVGHAICQQTLIVPEDRIVLPHEKKDGVTEGIMRKGAKEAVAGSGIVTGTVPERGTVIETVRGTKTVAVKEMEREDIAVTDPVRLAKVDIVTENATVIARASVKERIEIETGIADDEGMI